MSVNIRIILLDGRELDYTSPESLNIRMNRVADDLNNPDNRFSEYSYTFSLPKTKNNVEIFEYAGVSDIKNSFKTNPIECRLYKDEKLIIDGQIELRSVNESYNCVFYSKFVQLVDAIKDKNLRDIKSLPHISGFTYEDYIRTHINADYKNCDETPYQFPFVYYNTFYTPAGVYSGITDQDGVVFRKDTNKQNYYNLLNRTTNPMPNEFYFHQFPLSFYLKPVLEAMLKDAGWTLGGSFFENENIKKIIMPYVGDSDVYDLATYCSKEPQVTYEIVYNWVQEVPNMSLKSAAITNVNRISPTIYFDDIVGTDIILDSLTGTISGSTVLTGSQYVGDYSSGDFNLDTRKYQIVASQTFVRKDYVVTQNGNFISSGSTTFDQQVVVYPGISKFLDPIVAQMTIADGDVIRIEVTEYFTVLDCTIDGTVDYGTTPSPTPNLTPSVTRSVTPTPSITPSLTPSISSSPLPPSPTPSITPTRTITPSLTPSITPTRTVTPTHTPTPSASFVPSYNVKTLVVAGGGGGASGGGGGGGVIYNASYTVSIGAHTVTVGNGGTGGSSKSNGQDSSFMTLTAIGGGCGGFNDSTTDPNRAQPGGSGGGAGQSSTDNYGGAGTSGQGYKGGDCFHHSGSYPGAGGGGAGAPGGDTVNPTTSGNGGDGISCTIQDDSTKYYGGGGGGTDWGNSNPASGGIGGGGNPYSNGTPNTGGGGGAAGGGGSSGGNGGSGIVIIRYTTSQFGNCTGGTKTTVGSDTVHTFTSSGTMTFVAP